MTAGGKIRSAWKNPRKKLKEAPYTRWSGWLSLMMVAGYFVVGLWPFDFLPTNRVSWLTGRPGLQFAPYGMAYATGLLLGTSRIGRQRTSGRKFYRGTVARGATGTRQ